MIKLFFIFSASLVLSCSQEVDSENNVYSNKFLKTRFSCSEVPKNYLFEVLKKRVPDFEIIKVSLHSSSCSGMIYYGNNPKTYGSDLNVLGEEKKRTKPVVMIKDSVIFDSDSILVNHFWFWRRDRTDAEYIHLFTKYCSTLELDRMTSFVENIQGFCPKNILDSNIINLTKK